MELFRDIILLLLLLNSFFISACFAIQCYQCSSDQDRKGDDNCGAYAGFDREKHVAVDCMSDESNVPGTFCMKVTKQSPRGFIWDGRWRQVIRRCASVADTGVTGVCNWGVEENGIFWEECYCSEDNCNGAPYRALSPHLFAFSVLSAAIFTLRRW